MEILEITIKDDMYILLRKAANDEGIRTRDFLRSSSIRLLIKNKDVQFSIPVTFHRKQYQEQDFEMENTTNE